MQWQWAMCISKSHVTVKKWTSSSSGWVCLLQIWRFSHEHFLLPSRACAVRSLAGSLICIRRPFIDSFAPIVIGFCWLSFEYFPTMVKHMSVCRKPVNLRRSWYQTHHIFLRIRFLGNFSSPPDSCDIRPKRQCLWCLVSCHLKDIWRVMLKLGSLIRWTSILWEYAIGLYTTLIDSA